MSKLSTPIIAALLVLAPAAASADASVMGPDATACRAGATDPALLVRIDGFKTRTGTLRVQVYGSNPQDFLAKGKKLKRIDLPVSDAGAMEVCVALPKPGNYAVAVRHDVDGNGKSGWSDGGGFSRNPKISLFKLKPSYDHVVIPVAARVQSIDVMLNYRNGLSIGPISLASR